jgi:uncharacterized protein YkwD
LVLISLLKAAFTAVALLVASIPLTIGHFFAGSGHTAQVARAQLAVTKPVERDNAARDWAYPTPPPTPEPPPPPAEDAAQDAPPAAVEAPAAPTRAGGVPVVHRQPAPPPPPPAEDAAQDAPPAAVEAPAAPTRAGGVPVVHRQPAPPPPPPPPAPPPISVGSTQQALINGDRAAAGLPPLNWSGCLAGVAYQNAARMAAQGFISHANGPSADLGCGLGSSAGENVGFWSGGVNDGQLNTMFMNSAGHRANIMGNYHYVGTAWVTGRNGAYIAVEFS